MEAKHEAVANEIRHLVHIAKPQISKFKIEIENKNVLVCMGNTRGGKSTVVNYIQGNELEAFEDSKRTFIKVKNSIHEGPVISHGSLSYTRFPSVWRMNDEVDTIIVDVPGFEDNRSVAYDVVNTLFFNQLKCARSVSLVLIVDINDIDSDNVQGFTKAVAKVQAIIDDFNELKDAVSVIFTKDWKNYSREDIAQLLQRKILDVPEMQVKKDLVYHLVKCISSIGILRMPRTGGPLAKDEVDCNIEGAIYSNQPIITNTNGIKFKLSEHAHHTLLDIYQECIVSLDFLSEAKRCISQFEPYFTIDKYVFASTEDELGHVETQLQYILPRITTERVRSLSSIMALKESLCNVAGRLSELFDHKLSFLAFMDEWSVLDENVKQVVIDKHRATIVDLEDRVDKLIGKINAEVEERTQDTVQHILSQAASDRTRFIVMGSSFIPLVTRTLTAAGIPIPGTLAIEVAEISSAGYGLAGAGVLGAAAGGYAVLYYKTIALRRSLRKEQGR